MKFYNAKTGDLVEKPSDLDYIRESICDTCGQRASGMMMHEADLAGNVFPVYFECFDCKSKGPEPKGA